VARNSTYVEARPERVFAVLRDPGSYGEWVMGSDAIRDADESWPEVGSVFHHRIGWGPLSVPDHTEVLECDPPHELVLRARARPLGTAIVRLGLEPEGSGTRVTMVEDPGDPLTALVFGPPIHLAVRLRNVVSLRRLRGLAELWPVPADDREP